jgi:hypothetical protein
LVRECFSGVCYWVVVKSLVFLIFAQHFFFYVFSLAAFLCRSVFGTYATITTCLSSFRHSWRGTELQVNNYSKLCGRPKEATNVASFVFARASNDGRVRSVLTFIRTYVVDVTETSSVTGLTSQAGRASFIHARAHANRRGIKVYLNGKNFYVCLI